MDKKYIIGEVGVFMSKQGNKYSEGWLPVKNITNGLGKVDIHFMCDMLLEY